MSAQPIRVAVVGDCPVFRLGLAQMIESATDLQLTLSVPSPEEAETVTIPDLTPTPDPAATPAPTNPTLRPGDVLLLDLQLPPAPLAAVVHRLGGLGAEVLVLCSGLQQDVVPQMQAGARGCLSRQAGELELLSAVRLVASGCSYVSAALAVRPLTEPLCRVTERERQILALLANGETDHGIAHRLGISEHTVHSHLDRLRDKIGSRRRADLTRFAVAHDIVP
ncbi:response regulator transcription factor [Kitasatospora sp. NBC_01539]|uniref:response regulator transcription factor n=1 Tax=Kitasatospora sp. NBC_01539 TaxID=2903577 RepID=UPI0038601022